MTREFPLLGALKFAQGRWVRCCAWADRHELGTRCRAAA